MDNYVWLEQIELLALDIYYGVFGLALLVLVAELAWDAIKKRFKWDTVAESASSLFTQAPYYAMDILFYGFAYAVFFTIYEYVPWKIESGWITLVAALFIADFTYFAEHYIVHKVRLLWVAHSVHHSSYIMNASVTFRSSIFDPVLAMFFHLPMVLMGFNPIIIVIAQIIVQAYQFFIHTEHVGKLGPLEKVFNTPSHHRVHHGSDKKYIDKNFGGILIIWDRLFGTFQEEEEKPTYGLTNPINSKNPVMVQFHEAISLYRAIKNKK